MNNALGFIKSPAKPAPATTAGSGAGVGSPDPSPTSVVRHSRHPWRIPASPQYLRAVREADLAVRRATFRWIVLRHSSRLLEP